VSYMWEDILTKDTVLDLINKFIFLEVKEEVDELTGKKKVKEKSFAEQLGLTEDTLMMYGGALLVLLIIIVVAVRSKINSDIRKNREKSIRLGTSTSADMLGSPQRRRTPRRR